MPSHIFFAYLFALKHSYTNDNFAKKKEKSLKEGCSVVGLFVNYE